MGQSSRWVNGSILNPALRPPRRKRSREMSTEFKREERYLVFKLSDVEEHFTPGERQQLARLAEVQRVGRSEGGKPLLECVEVESDWPEYEPTWNASEARMTGTQPAPSVPDADELAHFIRRIDGAQDLGASALAEAKP